VAGNDEPLFAVGHDQMAAQPSDAVAEFLEYTFRFAPANTGEFGRTRGGKTGSISDA
jgi:hypothetical protein